MVIGIDTKIEARAASLVTRQSHHNPRQGLGVWWDYLVMGGANLIENRGINFNFILIARWQTIVTAAPLVTPC